MVGTTGRYGGWVSRPQPPVGYVDCRVRCPIGKACTHDATNVIAKGLRLDVLIALVGLQQKFKRSCDFLYPIFTVFTRKLGIS